MLVGDLKNHFELSVSNQPSLVEAESNQVRITVMGDGHHTNPTIHTEKHHLDLKLKLGSYISIASSCKFFLSGNHDWKRTTTYLNPFKDRDSEGLLTNGGITVESDVWLGDGVKVMSGVTIGVGAVIASGSIVTKDVEPYSIVGGSPAKLIKKRFDDITIERLLKSEWWKLPVEEIEKRADLLFSRSINEFLDSL